MTRQGRPNQPASVTGASETERRRGFAIVTAVLALFLAAAAALGPAPTQLIYAILLAGTLVLAAATRLVNEPSLPRQAPHLLRRPGLEPGVRTTFIAVLPALVATWALGELYLSLGPSIAYSLQGNTNRILGGLVVALLAGAGFGAAFLGAFRTLVALATPTRRGELATAIYLAAYLGFSLPVILAGIATTHIGLRSTAIGYGAVVVALALTALVVTPRIGAGSSAVAARDPAIPSALP